MVRVRAVRLVLVLLSPVLPISRGAAQSLLPIPDLRPLPIRVLAASLLPGTDSLLGQPTDLVLRPDGSLCFPDIGFHRVTCVAEDGALLFHSGREGQGPGEFVLPYRLGALPDNSLVVFDAGNQTLSRLDAAGRFTDRWALPFLFHQVNGMVGPDSHTIAISGFAPSAGQSGDSAIHVFTMDSTLRHTRSFGPLPEAANREVLSYWGTGRLGAAARGAFLLVQRLPYHLLTYTPRGRLVRQAAIPGRTSRSADEAFAIRKDLSSTSVTSTASLVIAPSGAVELDDGYLLAFRTGTRAGTIEQVWWDLIDARTGRLVGSTELPKDFLVIEIAGRSRSGSLLGAVLLDDVPALVRIDFRLTRSDRR